jgi:hypothetical protein
MAGVASNFWRWLRWLHWQLSYQDWRIVQDSRTGLWHVEFNHEDLGWVRHTTGHEFAWQAAVEGRKEYEWDTQ